MEVHPPTGHVTTPKEFLIHMSMITAGILIALSLEGMREWWHHKSLVRQAKETIATEMRENKERVDGMREKLGTAKKDIEDAVAAVDILLKTGKLTTNQMKVGYQATTLQDSAWKTASVTGAVGHMEYGDVKRYADTYGLQEEYVRNQRRAIDAIPGIMASFHAKADPSQWSREDLLKFRERALDLLGILQLEESLGKGLSELYGKTLPGK